MSYAYVNGSDQSPIATIHNARILIPSLSDQIGRYGLRYTAIKSETMVGQLQGSKENFEAMIHSYGFMISSPGPRIPA
jgi:hypothetical protein